MSIAKCLESIADWLEKKTIQRVYCDRIMATSKTAKAVLEKYNIRTGFFCIEDPMPWN